MAFPIETYQQNGIAAPIRVMSEEAASALADRVAETRRLGERAELGLRRHAHLVFPWLHDLATSDAVLDPVERILGPDILIWSSGFFIKDPGDGKIVSWHQDATYWGLEPPTILTAWIALTPSTVESGCLKVAPGTHRMDQLPHADSFAENNLLSRGQEIAVDMTDLDRADIVLRPGEMSLHHVQLVHGSEPNRASWPRLGYAIRYIPTSVRQTGGRTYATLARGQDRYGHFDLAPRPDAAMSEAALALADEAEARLRPILMEGT